MLIEFFQPVYDSGETEITKQRGVWGKKSWCDSVIGDIKKFWIDFMKIPQIRRVSR